MEKFNTLQPDTLKLHPYYINKNQPAMKQMQIHLPKPCHENWDAMTLEQKGRFCQSCQKTVYDFTAASDRQLIAHLQIDPGTCGRFLVSQLDRNLIVPHQKSTVWATAFAGFASLFVLGNSQASAQTKQESVRMYRDKYHIAAVTQKTDKPQIDTLIPIKISGTVIEGGLPIPSANIAIKGQKIYAQSDFDGHFSIDAYSGDTLRVSFVGYQDYELLLTQSDDKLVVELESPSYMFGGVVAGFVIAQRPSFIRRQLWYIGNWFR